MTGFHDDPVTTHLPLVDVLGLLEVDQEGYAHVEFFDLVMLDWWEAWVAHWGGDGVLGEHFG